MRKAWLLLALLPLLLPSCDTDPNGILQPGVTGSANEILVVVNDNLWEGAVGDSLRDTYMQMQLALPEAEPMFGLVSMPAPSFTKIFQTNRNLVRVMVNPAHENRVEYKKNVWAAPQAVIDIYAADAAACAELIGKQKDKLLAFMLQAEWDRHITNARKYEAVPVGKFLREHHGVSLYAPTGFDLARTEDDFVWIDYETPELSMGLFVYHYPYVDFETFTPKYLIAKRDSFLRLYVPGPTEGSYMATETQVPFFVEELKHDSKFTVETRGLWRVENDFMGGPFVGFTLLDEARNRIVTVEGFVYAPNVSKRGHLRQLEAILHTVTIPDDRPSDQ